MLFTSLFAVASASLASAAAVKRASITDYTTSPITFEFPAGRTGFSSSAATTAPCGGMPSTTRTKYPLRGGDISTTQKTALDNLNFLYFKGDDPTKFHSFATYTNTVKDIGAGHYCTEGPDFQSLGFQAGDHATLLAIYALDGKETMYYQCADIELVDSASFVADSKYTCGNYTSELNIASSEDSLTIVANQPGTLPSGSAHPNIGSDVAATASAVAAKSGITAAQGGGIGAGVTLGVVFLLFGALYAVGRLHFGKRVAPVSLDDSSSTNSIMKQRV